MRTAFRVLVTLFVFLASYWFVFWVPFAFLPLIRYPLVTNLVSFGFALFAARYIWLKLGKAPSSLVSSVIMGAAVLGGIGFCGGFIGPLIFTPDANQGPLLGIFITGPAGFALGGVGGLGWWWMKRRTTGRIG